MFIFRNLDDKTRRYMIEEIILAKESGNLYFSTRFNRTGISLWFDLLREAAEKHNEHWLAFQVETKGLLKELEGARTPSFEYTIKHVPYSAAETIAEGQFNRFYILGICRYAIDKKIPYVKIYRAKPSRKHRPESDSIIGRSIKVDDLLSLLRDVKKSLNYVLLKPNSGLSVEI